MSIKIDLSGLDKFQKDLTRKVNEFNSKPKTLADVFDHEFMTTYTKCNNINDFFENGGFTVNSKQDFENIQQSDLDKYVASCTSFANWNDMYKTAGTIYAKKNLF